MFVDASRCFSPLILTSASIFLGLRRLRHQRRKTEHCPQTRVAAITSGWNRLDHFEAALADIFVASGVLRKRIVGPGTVFDRSVEAIIQRGVDPRPVALGEHLPEPLIARQLLCALCRTGLRGIAEGLESEQ